MSNPDNDKEAGPKTLSPGEIRRNVSRELLSLAWGNTFTTSMGIIILAPIVATVLWETSEQTALLVWVMIISGIVIFRFWLSTLFDSSVVDEKEVHAWSTRFIMIAAFSGIAWGSLGVWFFPEGDTARQVFIVLAVGGLCAGAVSSNAPILGSFYAFSIPAFLPIIINLFIHASNINLAIGSATIVYAFAMASLAKKVHLATVGYIELKFENIEEKQKVDAANIKLRDEIEERTKTEEALSISEERYRTIVDLSPDGIIVHCEGKLVFINKAGADLMGVTSIDSVLGKPVIDFVAPESHSVTLARMKEVMEKKVVAPVIESAFLRQDGSRIDVDVTGAPLIYYGKPSIMAIFRDITERKRAEEKLRASEESLATAQKVARLGSWDWDCEKNKVSWSGQLSRMVGVEIGSMAPTYDQYLTIVHPIDRERVKRIIMDAVVNHQPCIFEHRMINHRGEELVVRETIKVFVDDEGDTSRIVGAIHDITELKKAEEEIREAKERAEDATRLKDRFVSLVAHDLKTPLTSIIGFMEHLDSAVEPPIPQKYKKVLNLVIESSQGMSTMIDRLLNINMLQSGKIKPAPQFVDGHMIIGSVLANTTLLAKNKGISIIDNTPPRTRLYADIGLYPQVIQNLLSNAIKFCNDGDQITISVKEKEPTTICVADTGVGIDPKVMDDLFHHEIKTSSRGTAGEMGTGLGLPYSYDIMEAHGGELTVESKPGEGTIFCACLPLVKPTVMVVEDTEHDRILFKSLLDEMDVNVVMAEDAEKALAEIEHNKPDLFLIDLFMPGMDGFELIQRIKRNPMIKTVPIIVVTAEDSTESREKAFRLSANDFIGKPAKTVDVIPRIRRFIS